MNVGKMEGEQVFHCVSRLDRKVGGHQKTGTLRQSQETVRLEGPLRGKRI